MGTAQHGTDTEHVAGKRSLIAAFFDDALDRVDWLATLHACDRKSEALTLCLTYIDSFGQWLFWPRDQSGRNFVEALAVYGKDPYFARVHPRALEESLLAMKGSWKVIAPKVSLAFPGPDYELLEPPDVLTALSPVLHGAELARVTGEIWRGTVANVAYKLLRNPSVHSFGASSGIEFSRTMHAGSRAPTLGFERLLPALRHIVREAHDRSLATGQWFGDDTILLGK